MRSGGGGGVEVPDELSRHRTANSAWLFCSALSVKRSFVPSVLKSQGRLHSMTPCIHSLACWIFSSTLLYQCCVRWLDWLWGMHTPVGQALTGPQTQVMPLPFTLTVKGTFPALPSLCKSVSVLLLAFVFTGSKLLKS